MGIDAKIYLKVPTKPTEAELLEWSWLLGESIRADKLFIDRDKGHKAIDLVNARYFDPPKYDEEAKIGKVIHPDGDDILAGDAWFLEVHVWTRYYGVGYERGDLLSLCAIAEWCEANVPACEVWYGGDSSGCGVEPWPDAERRKLRAHLYSPRGREYFKYSSRAGRHEGPEKPPPSCALCPPSGPRWERYGWGREYCAISCGGCGTQLVSRDGCSTWKTEKEDSNSSK